MKNIRIKYLVILILFFCNQTILFAFNQAFELRRTDYNNNAITTINSNSICIQAYKNIPIDSQILNTILRNIASNSTSDFDIVKLVRVLCLSHGEYDSIILPVLRPIPFWLEANETNREYWSENHMIMWMSSDWLLHEKYGKVVDSTLDKRLRHYLQLKIQYGFYEFNSSTYAPYCLTGLLNLADFSQDAQIKDLATQASLLLLKEILSLTNNKGVFFPVAGRNYADKYENAYGANHNHLIYLLTGMGEAPANASHAGAFLATSTIFVDDVINSWTPTLNRIFTQGHSLINGINNINNTMSTKDKVIFQWSSGAYFHPDVAKSTFKLLNDLNLWNHFEFDDFRQFSSLPIDLAPVVAEVASPISKSSGLYNPTIAIFKNKEVTLSSIQDFWKGKNGYQQFPVVANVGTTAIFTLSGKPVANWADRPSIHANTHLPYVQQKDNIALVMYRAEKTLSLFGYTGEKLDVALHWQTNKFNEIREVGNWILGREENGYVAVRRHCVGIINGVQACDNPDGQTWIIIVGNSDMYGSFDAFEQKINQSRYEEKWYFNFPTLQWVYYAKIEIDDKTLEYAWNGDILSGPSAVTPVLNNKINTKELTIYPNPASDIINIEIPYAINTATIKILNTTGATIYNENFTSITNNIKTISTQDLAEGMYLIQIETEKDLYVQKLIIKR